MEAAKQWKAGRGFIKALITLCGADVNACVEKLHFEAGKKIPKEEEKQYLTNSKSYIINST